MAAEHAAVGRTAAGTIKDLPRGRARQAALRAFYSELPKEDKTFLMGLATDVCSELEVVKQSVEVELAVYTGLLMVQQEDRKNRRKDEMPGRPDGAFEGTKAFACKEGTLDTGSEEGRRMEFTTTCPVSCELLETMVTSPWRKGLLQTAQAAQLSEGAVKVQRKKMKVRESVSLSGDEVTERVQQLSQPIVERVSVMRDLILSGRLPTNSPPPGCIERALWTNSSGGTLLDLDVKCKEGLRIGSTKIHDLESEIAANFKTQCLDEVCKGIRRTSGIVELDDNHNPHAKCNGTVP